VDPGRPVSFNSDTIRYVRGSHRWGFFKPNVFVSQMAFPGADGDTLPDIDGHEEEYDIVSSELEPGDLLVHHHLTVHGSAGNATLRQTRRAASLRYCGDDIRFKFRPYAPAQAHFNHQPRTAIARLRTVPGGVAVAGTVACRRLEAARRRRNGRRAAAALMASRLLPSPGNMLARIRLAGYLQRDAWLLPALPSLGSAMMLTRSLWRLVSLACRHS
jgi:Phytanoyl-CoA dioxygenase (PhyH)